MKKANLSFAFHTSPKNHESAKVRLTILLQTLKGTYRGSRSLSDFEGESHPKSDFPLVESKEREFVVMPSNRNCVVETFCKTGYQDEASPAFEILSRLISRGDMMAHDEGLHKHVVQKGRAFKAGCHFHPLLGTLSMFSTEDPHSLKTFENFERVYQKLADGQFT